MTMDEVLLDEVNESFGQLRDEIETLQKKNAMLVGLVHKGADFIEKIAKDSRSSGGLTLIDYMAAIVTVKLMRRVR